MKITGVKTYILERLLGNQAFGRSPWLAGRRQAALCVASTDEGIEGVGEVFYIGGPAKVVAGVVSDALEPLIIGKDPFDNAVVWDFL